MELPVRQVSRKDFWNNHIKAAEKFDGPMKVYCLFHGLNPGSLSANRKKLGFSKYNELNPSDKEPTKYPCLVL